MDFLSLQEMPFDEADFSLKLHAIDHNMKPCRFMEDLANQTAISKGLKNEAVIQNGAKQVSNGREYPKRHSERVDLFENLQENRRERASMCQNNAYVDEQQERKQNFRKKITIQKKLSDLDHWNGEGIVKLTDGKVVIGTWKNGKLVGTVKIIYASKDIYVGEVLNYQRHGNGILTFSDGIRYQGGFCYGKFDGYGTLYDSFGCIDRRGTWQRGHLIAKDT